MSYEKPLPEISPPAEPYWDAASDERLLVQYCQSCSTHIFPPRYGCPHCYSFDDLTWVESNGSGTVYTYSVVHHPAWEVWEDEVPYVYALINLDNENVNLISHVVNISPDGVTIDMPVEVVFDHVSPGITLPKFEPAGE